MNQYIKQMMIFIIITTQTVYAGAWKYDKDGWRYELNNSTMTAEITGCEISDKEIRLAILKIFSFLTTP